MDHVSWAVYHSNGIGDTRKTSISVLLPLFPNDLKSVAMIKHSMDLMNAVNIVNHGHTPVIACDHPLYKIAKDIQCSWSETHGEDSYVVILGDLHIKMTLLKCIGDLFNRSGRTYAITHANITTPGTAESFLKASHVKKTTRAHQVTGCVLYTLQDAYIKDDSEISRANWPKERSASSVQCKFWKPILKNVLTLLTWNRAIHKGNFP